MADPRVMPVAVKAQPRSRKGATERRGTSRAAALPGPGALPRPQACGKKREKKRRGGHKAVSWGPPYRRAERLRSTARGLRADVGTRPGTTVKKQAEADHVLPKGRRAKRLSAADDSTASPSYEASAAKRPRGRPPKGVSAELLAPKPIATAAARKLRKAANATQPASEDPSTSKAAATKSPRVSRRKRSRSSFPSNTNDTDIEAPKHRSAKREVSRGRSRRSSRSRHGGRARKARCHESSAVEYTVSAARSTRHH
ncbi:hypothetical protein MTO96_011138 [Rhipicephalus appendiculatus]